MALAVGTVAPSFTTINDEGQTVSLSDFQGKVVVLYFYPKDDTPGCTKEAQSFRDNYAEYQGKDMVVLGVSMDDEASHKAVPRKSTVYLFNCLADTDGTITKAYDIYDVFKGHGYSKRVTYIINPEGKISHVDSNVNTNTHAQDILLTIG